MYLISLDGAELLSEDFSADPEIDAIRDLSDSAISGVGGGCSGNSCTGYSCSSYACAGNACGGYACGIQGCAGNICAGVICGARFGVAETFDGTSS